VTRAAAAVVLVLVLGACSAAGERPVQRSGRPLPPAPPPPAMLDEGVACAADVKTCTDGSYVGRDPAAGCAFKACPGANNK
jgi:hypothetical protein